MATQQDHGGVPFAVAHDMRQFRLLELPPDIVELLDAPSPPPYVSSLCCPTTPSPALPCPALPYPARPS